MRRLTKLIVCVCMFSLITTASVWAQVLQNKQQPYKIKSAIQMAEEGKKQAAETAKKYGIGRVPSYLDSASKSKSTTPNVTTTATTTAKTTSKPSTSGSSGNRKKTTPTKKKSNSYRARKTSSIPTINSESSPISDENLNAARNARGFGTGSDTDTGTTASGTSTSSTPTVSSESSPISDENLNAARNARLGTGSDTDTGTTASSGSTTTTTTTENSRTVVTQSTSSPSASVTTDNTGEKTTENQSGTTGSQTETSGKTEKTDKDKKDEKIDVNYTGAFNDRQLIPNSMAIFCKTNVEDMLKENKKLYDCVNKIVQKINNKDAMVRQEGSSELSNIRYEELKTMLAQSITKGATISNYEKIQNDTGEAASKTQTEHEDNVAIANTISTLTDVINSMRDLYAERLKAEAITGIVLVDPSVITDIKNEDDGKSDQIDTVNKSNDPVVSSSSMTITSENEEEFLEDGEVGDWNWLRDNTCRRNKVEFGQGTYEDGICPDGVYKTGSDDTKVYCQGGECREIYMSGKCGDDSLTVVSSPKPVQLQGAAKCTDGTKEVACSDGMYVLDGYYYACKGGSCERCSSVSTVTSSSASTSATTEQGENETTETAESSSAQNNSDIDARVASILANEQKRREKAGSISDPEARKKLEEEDKAKYENYINNLQGQNESGSSSAQNNSDVDARVASILANEQKRREKAGSISDPEARKKLEEEDKAKYGNFINNLQGQNESGSSEQSSQENLPSDLDSVRRHRGY